LHQGKIDEAEQLLLEANNKDPNDAEVLANLIVCSHLGNKPAEVVSRYMKWVSSMKYVVLFGSY
jgi:coatomer protein complex subunit epsilon